VDDHERTILEAWKEANAGASGRLARRAWIVLQRHQRVHPLKLAAAVGTSREAAKWLSAFDRMGLVGLFDVPRSGRPASVLKEGNKALDELGGGAARRNALTPFLHRNAKEALWRVNRLTGEHVNRKHRWRDLPLRCPPECPDLGAVFIGPGLRIIAAIRDADEVLGPLLGTWLGVRHLQRAQKEDLHSRLNVLSVIGTSELNENACSASSWSHVTAQGNDHFQQILTRFMMRLANLADAIPGRVQIHPIIDLEGEELPIKYMTLCRKLMIWSPVNNKFPSSIEWHRPIAYKKKIYEVTPENFANLSSGVTKQFIDTFYKSIMNPKYAPFAWVRDCDSMQIV
jgi:hypothetical protein